MPLTQLIQSPWCPMDLGLDVVAPVRQLDANARTATDLRTVIEQFAGQARYARRDVTGDHVDETFCNFFVRDVLAQLGVTIPRMRANELYDWFPFQRGTWASVPAWIGRDLATHCGSPVVAVWKNPSGRAGHIALLAPSRSELDNDTTFIAQAGSTNFTYGRLNEGFGSQQPLFYAAH